MSGSPLMMNPGQSLQVVYQIWVAPKDLQSSAGQNLQVHYALGQPANIGTSTTVDDVVSMGQFDATGSLVNGKKFPLNPQWIGSYMLAVAVSHTGTAERASATLNFRAVGGELTPRPWDVADPSLAKDADQGVLDQQRGLCYVSLGQVEEARLYFRRSLERDHGNEVARSRLVDAYYSQRDYSAVVSLYNDAGATDETDSQTLSHIASSLVKTGDTKRAIALLEQSLHSRPEDGGIYLVLAECYEQAGDTKKAAEMTQKGRSYLSAAAQPATP
jgi:tetratricopeptide (TPR) repeat protein